MDLYFKLPTPDRVLYADFSQLMLALTVFKLAGQLAVTTHDLENLCADFHGVSVNFDSTTEQFIMKLHTKPPEGLFT